MALLSCQQTISTPRFRIPVIIQQPDTGSVVKRNVDHVIESSFYIYGKFPFKDSIAFIPTRLKNVIPADDLIHEYSRPKIEDTLATDGFQLFIDAASTLHFKVYDTEEYYIPLYVVNETNRTKVFIGKDNHAFGLIEAVDTTIYDWKPITCDQFDFCGNGYLGIKVHPGEFVLCLIPKFTGNHQGRMRIRLKMGESLYVSSFYSGTFNYSQFEIKKGTWPYDVMKEKPDAAIPSSFFGVAPKGYE